MLSAQRRVLPPVCARTRPDPSSHPDTLIGAAPTLNLSDLIVEGGGSKALKLAIKDPESNSVTGVVNVVVTYTPLVK